MKCPKCGAYNKPEYKKCYVCSTILPDSGVEDEKNEPNLWSHVPNDSTTKEAVDTGKDGYLFEIDLNEDIEAQVKQEQKNYAVYTRREQTKQRGVWGQRSKPKHGYRGENSIPIVALDDESQTENNKKRRRGSRYKVETPSKNAEKIGTYREGQEIGVIIPPEPPKQRERIQVTPRTKKKKNERYSNIKWGRLILVCIVAAAMIFGVVIGISYLIRSVSSSMSQIFVARDQLPNGGQPLVERVLIEGQTWHRITFYGEDGDKILVEDESHNIKRTLTVQGNEVVLELDDYNYIPLSGEEYYDKPFAYIDLKAWHFDKEGVETELNVPEYRISIPLAPLTIIYPTEQNTTVDATEVLIKVKVDSDSRVLIGKGSTKKNLSANIDAYGYTSTYVDIEPGENTITVQVEKDGYRANVFNVAVECPERDVYIEFTDAPTQEQNKEIKINGITEPGATVTTDAKLTIDNIIVDPLTGKFYIRIMLNDFGWNEINMFATMPDGRTARMTHNIYRIPLEGAYTRSAWALDYTALTSRPDQLKGQVYVLNGTIVERIDTPQARMFLFNAGTEAEPKMLMVRYDGLNDLKEDVRYNAYADVMGKFDNYPYLWAKYIYEEQVVEEDTEDDASTDSTDE